MTEMINSSELFEKQSRINEVTQMLKQNATVDIETFDTEKPKQIYNFSYKVGDGYDPNERVIMLASVSKVALSLAQANNLNVNYASSLNQKYELNESEITELLFRQPLRVFAPERLGMPDTYHLLRAEIGLDIEEEELESFASLVKGSRLESKNEEERNLNPVERTVKSAGRNVARLIPAVLKSSFNKGRLKSDIKNIMERINFGIKSYLKKYGPIEVSFGEILYQSLTLSSNSATTVLKNRFGDFEENSSKYLQNLTPSFEPTISTDNFIHWMQEGANTGKLSEMADLQHQLVINNLGFVMGDEGPLTGEEAILKGLINNSEKFDFSFTESDEGQALIRKGYKIIEKTGYFYATFWQKRLALQGNPCHMTHSSVVTLISPEGEVTTFAAARGIEMPIPHRKIYPDGIVAPSTTVDNYSDKFVDPVYPTACHVLQQQLIELANDVLGVE